MKKYGTTFLGYIMTLAGLMMLFSLPSCKKYLDEKRNAAETTPSTLTDLQALLDDAANMNRKEGGIGEASADDYYLPQSSFASRPVTTQQVYLWQTPVYNYPNDYNEFYYPVYTANQCLEALEKIDRTVSNADGFDNIKGSSLFFRAYYFNRLVWNFSKAYDEGSADKDLGIALRLNTNFNETSVRASVATTYKQIIDDLKMAAALLPNQPQHVLRPSKAAAYAALARTYLSMRKYDSAYKYADLSLQIKSTLMDFNDTKYNLAGTLPFPRYNDEVIFQCGNFSTNLMSFGLISPARAIVDSLVYKQYNVNDLRKKGYFRTIAAGPVFKGMYSGTTTNYFTGLAVDEILLIRAECQARIGDFLKGMDDLNTLLVKRWLKNNFTKFSAASKEEALSIILVERRKELLLRDLRWQDVKRLNKEGANITLKRVANSQTYTLPPNDNRFAFPLPNDVIKLSSMPQNPY